MEPSLVVVSVRSGMHHPMRFDKNDSLRTQHEMLRSGTRFGLAVLKLLSHLREVTPPGINLTGLAPAEKTPETIQERFRLKVTGKADLKLVPDVFEALKGYMAALKKFEVVLDADSTVGGDKTSRPKKNAAPLTSQPFSFVVTLDSGVKEQPDPEEDE